MTPATAPTPTGVPVIAWRNALFVVLGVNGFAIACLMARTPSLRDHLDVEPGEVGLLLAFLSIGSVLGLAFSGPLLHSVGARRLIQLGLPAAAIVLAGIGLTAGVLGSYAATATVAFLFGGAIALADVATNVEGAANERALGRSVLPFLHAGFSLGTVVGASLGALAALADVPIVWHFALVALLVAVTAIVAPRWIPDISEDEGPKPTRSERLAIWREPRTILLGVVVFAFAYIEGAANDWLTLGLVDDRGFAPASAAMMLAVFTGAMTVGRLAGSRLVDRFGRVAVLVVSGLLAAAGLTLVIFVPEVWAIVVGTIVWALGSSLGFPIGISAAGDDPARASSRVAVVSVIAYAAFFAGPPAIGLLADHFGILPSLTVILGLVAIAIAVSPAARARRPGIDPGIRPSAVGADPGDLAG